MNRSTGQNNTVVYAYGMYGPVPYQYINGQVVYMVYDKERKAWRLPK